MIEPFTFHDPALYGEVELDPDGPDWVYKAWGQWPLTAEDVDRVRYELEQWIWQGR